MALLLALVGVGVGLGVSEAPSEVGSSAAATTTTALAAPTTSAAPAPSTTTTIASPPTTPPTTVVLPPATSTQVLTYDPYMATGALAPTVVVTKVLTANACVSTGIAGQGSYRCFTTPSPHIIFDPCFAAPGQSSGPVVCPIGDSLSDVVKITVATLPAVTTLHPAERPWRIELSNGQVCKLLNAALGGAGPFFCDTPGPIDDCRTPVEATPTWSVACQPARTTTFVTYPVEEVWS